MAQHRVWVALVDCEGLIQGLGHVLGAKRGGTCPIPAELEGLARQYMVPQDEGAPAKPAAPPPAMPAGDRASAINAALEGIAARNNVDDFASKTNLPLVGVVRSVSGIADVSVGEVQQGWEALQAAVAAG